MKNQNSEKPHQTTSEKEKMVRDPAQVVELTRSFVPFYMNMSLVIILLAILLAGIILLLTLITFSFDYEYLAVILNSAIVGITVLLFLIYFSISYLNYQAVAYSLIPGVIQKTELDTIDHIPGKILIKEGFFHRNKVILAMNDFDRLKIEKSFFGRMYNYGHIYVIQQDELNRSEDYVLTHVSNPEEASALIQKMIDVDIFKSTPARGTSKDQKNSNKGEN